MIAFLGDHLEGLLLVQIEGAVPKSKLGGLFHFIRSFRRPFFPELSPWPDESVQT
jgi:hypothetical protein